MKHISSLDGLRGAAALLVVFFHYFPREGVGLLGRLMSIGWIGVDIFFVLSGFLITTILYEQRGADHYFRNFYIRRLLRLSPIYYLLFAIALVSALWMHIPLHPLQLGMLLYAANFVLPIDDSMGNIGSFELFHVWSLSVEEQFYLIWPWLVGGRLSKESLRKVCLCGILIAPILRLAMVYEHVYSLWIYQSLLCRMDSLLLGAFLALIPLPSLRTARRVACVALLVFGVTVWKGHTAFFQSSPIQGLGYSALAFLSASLLTMSLHPRTMVSRIFSSKLLRFYGKYSYGLYLWHFFLRPQFDAQKLWMERHLSSRTIADVISFVLVLAISTVIAMASYRWIEQPFLRLKSRFAPSSSVLASSGMNRKEARGREA